MHVVDIYRDNLLLFGIKPDQDSTHIKRIMGENELRINFVENQYINFSIGDKTTVFGETFYINTLPVVTKVSSREYKYQMTLQGTVHALARIQYLFLGDDNSLKEGEFSLTGSVADFLDLIIQNSKRLLPEFNYSIQQNIDDGYRTLTFSSENCLEALAKIAEAFNTEYWVEGTEISLTKMLNDTGRTFRHGKQKGLYEIIRQTVNNESVVTRLYAFGSDKNLPEGYRNYSKWLKLPIATIKTVTNITFLIFDHGDGTQTYTFTFDAPPGAAGLDAIQIVSRLIGSTSGFGNPSTALFSVNPRTYTTVVGNFEFLFRSTVGGFTFTSPVLQAIPSTIQPVFPFVGEVIYLDKNIDLYGLREDTKFFPEVYPHRTGTVTSVNGADPFEFRDASMDFDLNAHLLPGMTAKVTFNSGQLTGYTFEVSSYDNTLKRFIILKNKNERAQDVPSVDLRPAIGDKYVIVDIFLPQSYIDAAEAELETKAQAYLDTVADPQLTYQLIFDPVYLKEINSTLDIGDLIWIIDPPMQIEAKIRVITVQRNVVNEWEYTLEISNTLPKPKLSTLIAAHNNLRVNVSGIARNIQNNALLNQRVIGPIYYRDLTEYADNAAALAAGLTPGQAYRVTGTGTITVVI